MESRREERRLTTVLSVDVVGYSRLMAGDERQTLAQLSVHRKELLDPKTLEYRGRIVKLMGDGALMEFGSVVDAVLFAVDVQRSMAARNADIPADRQITFRIGINIGDIIVVGDDIYGDGVNVAGRLQSLAEPGGICIARNVYSQVKNKVEFGFQDLGNRSVKNIPEPIPTFGVRWGPQPIEPAAVNTRTRHRSMARAAAAAAVVAAAVGGAAIWATFPFETAPSIEAASLERMAFALPEEPSIAVRAFEVSPTDDGHQILTHGLAESITRGLADTPSLFVIAQHSTSRTELSNGPPKDLAERLGVKYVLAGTMTGNDDGLTVEVRLIDALGGRQLWQQTLNGGTGELYRIRNEVVDQVRTTLGGTALSADSADGDTQRRPHVPRGNSYANLLQGISYFWRSTPEDNGKAGQLFTKAVVSDPGFALAHAWNAWNSVFGIMMGWSDTPDEQLRSAFASARESVFLDPSLAFGRWALGITFLAAGDHASASEQFKRGLALAPNDPDLLAGAAKSLAFQNGALEAIEHGNRALRLNPLPPDWYLWNLGIANYFAGRYEDAIAVLQRASSKDPEARLYLVASYMESNRKPEARVQANEVFQRDPAFHIARYVDRTSFADPNDRQALVASLLAAGLPENVSFACMLEPTVENCR